MGGRYKSMEEMDCGDLTKLALALDGSDSTGQALALLTHVRGMTSRLTEVITPMASAIKKGAFKASRYRANPALANAISEVLQGNGASTLLNAWIALLDVEGVVTFRKELSSETMRTLKEMTTGKYESYEAAALEVRDRTRRIGRPTDRLASSRILLIKGLQYEHAVVANADNLGTKELYVAITRGSKSLAIQSSSKTICPVTKVQ